ncbi:MAG: cysteine hydrolase family protein [Pseudomonadota bacterium]
MNATLLMMDWQVATNDPSLPERGQHNAEALAEKLLAHWREMGGPIIHIRHDSMNPASPYAPDKPGNAFMKSLAPLSHETVVEKRTHNAFIGTDLMEALEEYGTSDLVVCGAHLEYCVESTVRMAGNLGFMVYLAGDACVAMAKLDAQGKKWTADEVHALTLAVLDGEYAKVVDAEELAGTGDTARVAMAGPSTRQ